ncbi:MAG: VOC family protein [Pseudomonadota bacterium]
MKTLGIENVAVVSSVLDPAFTKYENMGFKLTPCSEHFVDSPDGEQHAHRNRYAMFGNWTYFEIVTSPLSHLKAPGYDEALAKYGEHLAKIMFSFEDVKGVEREVEARGGVSPYPADVMVRVWQSDETGIEHIVPMDTYAFPEEIWYGFFSCALHHQAPEQNYAPEYLIHPNGVLGVSETIIYVENAKEAGERYAAYLGVKPHTEADCVLFDFDNGTRLSIYDGSAIEARLGPFKPFRKPSFTALSFKAPSLDTVRGIFDQNDVPYACVGETLVVDPEAALNAICIFEEAKA